MHPNIQNLESRIQNPESKIEDPASSFQLSHAFTIVELILVVSIIVLMMAISVPTLAPLLRGNAVSSGSSQLANTLNLARAKAITSRSHVRVIFSEIMLSPPDATNSYVLAKNSYSVLILTNQPSTTPANWVYIQRWQSLPKGAHFPALLAALPTLNNNPFPTNYISGGTSYSLPGIEFKSTGGLANPSSTVSMDLIEGTVINGSVVNSNSVNKMTVTVDNLLGKAKVVK